MTGKLIITLITASWLVMMYGLVRDEIVPAALRARELAGSASYEQLDKLVPESRVDQMGIFMGQDRIGRSVRWILRDESGLRLKSRTEINLSEGKSLGLISRYFGGLHAVINFSASVFDGRLVEFRSTVHAPPGAPAIVSIEGKPLGEELHLTIRQGTNLRVQKVPFDQRQFLSNSLAPGLSFRALKVGRTWQMKQFDPMSSAVQSVRAEVLGKEELVSDGMAHEVFKVQLTHQTRKIFVWVTSAGEVLKQQLGPFVFINEAPSEEALEELER